MKPLNDILADRLDPEAVETEDDIDEDLYENTNMIVVYIKNGDTLKSYPNKNLARKTTKRAKKN